MRCPSCHPPEPERLWRRGHRFGFDIDTQQIAGRKIQCIHAPAFQYLLPCLSHFSDNTSSLLSGRQRTERQRGFLTYQGPPTKVQNKIKSAHWHPTLGPLFQPPKGPMLLPYVVAPRAAGCMGVCLLFVVVARGKLRGQAEPSRDLTNGWVWLAPKGTRWEERKGGWNLHDDE